MNIQSNGIYQSDCLALLERIESEQVSLAYVDPPAFLSLAQTSLAYSVNKSENEKQAKIEVEETKELREHLSLMTKVLQQIHRVLCSHGNLFFQSEHYLAGDYRRILDQVFGRKKFQLEIIWPNFRANAHNIPIPRLDHYTIFLYSKGDHPTYNRQFKQLASADAHSQTDDRGPYKLVSLTKRISEPSLQFEWNSIIPLPGQSWIYSKEQLDEFDKAGRIYRRSQGQLPKLKAYLKENSLEVGSIWDDILPVSMRSSESLNFQAQRPLSLLDRIIRMGSNPGDLVLDPFCGSGTALVSAQMNKRKWLGCDLSTEIYSLAIQRIENKCKIRAGEDFNIAEQASLEQNFPVVYGVYNETVRDFDKQLQSEMFIANQPINIEETRHNEFKGIESSTNPVNKIKEQVDEYAVAFLNNEGGQILWGIRDSDGAVIGVKLSHKQRDEVRRVVSEKLHTIQPPIAPTAFRIELHRIYQDDKVIPDLYVVQLVVPAVSNKSLYYTSSGNAFVRTDEANKELKRLHLQAEILKRFSGQQ